ncbi:unnamed protein product [Pipistrellus nathusii]|uniref:Bone marrow stromal antigen 2 n=1 Tax=Pipistrellus nathusii TaxID=59473 RepID=A0ABP0A6E2_PIPNA
MAPCFYCRPPVPTHEYPKKLEDRKLPVWVGILMGLFVTSQVTLMIALLMEMARNNQQQKVVQKLQEEIKTLNQELQEKSCELEKKSSELQDKCMELQKKYEEVKQLRQENEALVSAKCPPNSGISLRLSMAPVLLTLSLQALLA